MTHDFWTSQNIPSIGICLVGGHVAKVESIVLQAYDHVVVHIRLQTTILRSDHELAHCPLLKRLRHCRCIFSSDRHRDIGLSPRLDLDDGASDHLQTGANRLITLPFHCSVRLSSSAFRDICRFAGRHG
jgi:hypothetical protein